MQIKDLKPYGIKGRDGNKDMPNTREIICSFIKNIQIKCYGENIKQNTNNFRERGQIKVFEATSRSGLERLVYILTMTSVAGGSPWNWWRVIFPQKRRQHK